MIIWWLLLSLHYRSKWIDDHPGKWHQMTIAIRPWHTWHFPSPRIHQPTDCAIPCENLICHGRLSFFFRYVKPVAWAPRITGAMVKTLGFVGSSHHRNAKTSSGYISSYSSWYDHPSLWKSNPWLDAQTAKHRKAKQNKQIYLCHMYIVYMYISIIIYICNCTARTGMLPGEVCFDCAGPVFYSFWDVDQLATWLPRCVSKTQHPKLQILKPKT